MVGTSSLSTTAHTQQPTQWPFSTIQSSREVAQHKDTGQHTIHTTQHSIASLLRPAVQRLAYSASLDFENQHAELVNTP